MKTNWLRIETRIRNVLRERFAPADGRAFAMDASEALHRIDAILAAETGRGESCPDPAAEDVPTRAARDAEWHEYHGSHFHRS